MPDNPFFSIESSRAYLALLAEVLEDVRHEVDHEIAAAVRQHSSHREAALRVVAYKIGRLGLQVANSLEILDELLDLRRALWGEPLKEGYFLTRTGSPSLRVVGGRNTTVSPPERPSFTTT